MEVGCGVVVGVHSVQEGLDRQAETPGKGAAVEELNSVCPYGSAIHFCITSVLFKGNGVHRVPTDHMCQMSNRPGHLC